MSDLASFNRDHVEIVYGTYPICAKGCKRADDLNHIMKRGNKKNKEDRKLHSSILNCICLCRACHDGDLHSIKARQFFIDIAITRIEDSTYVMNENDKMFITKYQSYFTKGQRRGKNQERSS